MIELLSVVGFAAALSSSPVEKPSTAAHPAPIAAAAARAFREYGAPPFRQASRQASAPARDSLKNGAFIGAVAGGVTGAMLVAVGCAAGSWAGERRSCAGAELTGAMIGAGLGALIGVGIDALFEQTPVPGGTAPVRLRGLQAHVRF